MKIINARGRTIREVWNIHEEYPANLYSQIAIDYSHLTSDADIKEFRERAMKEGAVVIIIQEYGQAAYIPISVALPKKAEADRLARWEREARQRGYSG